MIKPLKFFAAVVVALSAGGLVGNWVIPGDRLPHSVARQATNLAEYAQVVYDVSLDDVRHWRSLEELEWTVEGLERIAAALGGPARFRATLGGPLRISRWSMPGLQAFSPPIQLPGVGDLVLTDYNFEHGKTYAIHLIAHEIGHVLDWRSQRRLSGELAARMGALRCASQDASAHCAFDAEALAEDIPGNPDQPYGSSSAEEYWAEVFAVYLYPDYYAEDPGNCRVGPQTRQALVDLLDVNETRLQ